MTKFRIDAAIIGAPKCGSTSLYSYFSGQNDICAVPEAKDFPVFSRPDVLDDRLQSLVEFGYSPSSDTFQMIGDVAVCFEIKYLRSLQAVSADVKVIFLIRSPLRRIKSSYLFNVERLIEDRSLAEALNDEANGILPTLGSKDWRQKSYFHHSSYGEIIENCKSVFGEERLMVIDFDDLIGAFEDVQVGLESFLGVKFDAYGALPATNVTTSSMRSPFLTKLLFQGDRSSLLWALLRKFSSQKIRSKMRFAIRYALRKKGESKPIASLIDSELSVAAQQNLVSLEEQYQLLKVKYAIKSKHIISE